MRFFALGTLSIVALVAAACGGGGGGASPARSTAVSTPAASSATATRTPAASVSAPSAPASAGAPSAPASAGASIDAALTVQLAESSLGEIVVDHEGRTLYGFTDDVAADGEPTCYEGCAAAWPPLAIPGIELTVGEGLDDSMFTEVERTDDHGPQVVFNGIPLYYYADDAAPGDVNGQGVGEKWFVVNASGELVQDAAASPASVSSYDRY